MNVSEDLLVSFVGDGGAEGQKTKIALCPLSDEIFSRMILRGRGTFIIGGMEYTLYEAEGAANKVAAVKTKNPLVAKIYWPEESRASEVEILQMAKEYGRNIPFIRNHIPNMVCHEDPVFAGSSTSMIRDFLGLPTDGSRCLRVIVSPRLIPIRELKEKEMLLAYLQCFFGVCSC